jgi:hypothetical protein
MVKTGNMEHYSKQRGSREGQVSLMSQKGECGANLAHRNKNFYGGLLAGNEQLSYEIILKSYK